MNMYWNYYWTIGRAKLMTLMEYRVDILAATLGTYAYTVMTLMFIWVIFENVPSIAGWTKPEIFLLFGISQILFYVHFMFFWATYKRIPLLIHSGDLDLLLLKPIPPFYQMIISEFNLLDALPSFLIPVVTITYAFTQLNLQPSLWQVIITIFTCLLGIFISVSLHASISLSSFWLTDSRSLQKVYGELEDLRKYPLGIYPQQLKWFFIFVIPVGIVAYVPAYTLIYGISPDLIGLIIITAIIYFGTLKLIWHYGIRAYSSASS